MGAGNFTKTRYVDIKKGKMSIYAGKENPPIEYDYIEGNISKVDVVVEEFKGKKKEMIHVFIKGDENFRLKIQLNSGNGRTFCQQLPNVDPSLPVRFQAKYEEKEGFKNSTLFLGQNGQAVKWAHTKKDPNGMPEKKEATINGEKVFDRTEQMNFFKKIIENFKSPENGIPTKGTNIGTPQEVRDDLPF